MQGKIGLAVIEQRFRPANGDVTGFALRAVTTLMVVFTQMTTRAIAHQAVFEVFASVAVLTDEAAVTVF